MDDSLLPLASEVRGKTLWLVDELTDEQAHFAASGLVNSILWQKKYDAGLFAKVGPWKRIEKAEVKVVVQTKDERVAAVPITVETKVKLVPQWFGTFGATYEPVEKNVSYSLGITGTIDTLSVQIKGNYKEEDKKTSYGGGADLTWKPAAGVSVTGGASANRVDEMLRNPVTGRDDASSKTDVRVNLGVKVEFW